MRSISCALAVLLLAMPTTAGALGLLLDYSFDSATATTQRLNVSGGFRDGDGNGLGGAAQDVAWTWDVQAFINDARDEVTFGPSTIQISAPLVLSGVLDLGFSGMLPYTITYTSMSIELGVFGFRTDRPAAVDLSGGFVAQFGSFLGRVSGEIAIDGQLIPFADDFSGGSIRAWDGDFDPAADLSTVLMYWEPEINVFGGVGGIPMGQIAGIDMRFSPTFLFAATMSDVSVPTMTNDPGFGIPTPEPDLALMLVLGAFWVARRRER